MSTRSNCRTFICDDSGSIGMIFALSATVLFGATGMALDYGRAVSMQTSLQTKADAAALQGALSMKKTGGDTTLAIATAQNTLNGLLTDNGQPALVAGANTTSNHPALSVTASSTTGQVVVTASVDLKPGFLPLLGVHTMPISVTSTASVAVKGLDLGIMMDVTGSMGDADNTISRSECSQADGTKLGSARCAAADLMTILYPHGDNASIRTAIAPFSQSVDVDLSIAKDLTRQNATRSCQNYKVRTNYSTNKNNSCYVTKWTTSSSCYTTTTYCSGDSPSGTSGTDYAVSGSTFTQYLQTCMFARANRNTTDNVPSAGDWNASWSTSSADSCVPNAKVLPLTSSLSTLTAKFNSLNVPNGSTAGHLGTEWAWYAISPNFASVWPTTSQPAAYDDPKTIKAVILMTDGDYNLHSQCTSSSSSQATCSRADARATCTAMKAKGITVFAVGFGISNGTLTPAQIAALPETDARKVLADCASPGQYYFPYNGAALRSTFSNIGQALTAVLGNVRLGTN